MNKKQYFCNPINVTYQYQFNQKGNGFSLLAVKTISIPYNFQ